MRLFSNNFQVIPAYDFCYDRTSTQKTTQRFAYVHMMRSVSFVDTETETPAGDHLIATHRHALPDSVLGMNWDI